jgi:hypothetical protein
MNVLPDLPVVVIAICNLYFILPLVLGRHAIIPVVHLFVQSVLLPPVGFLASANMYSLRAVSGLDSSRRKPISSSEVGGSWPALSLSHVIACSFNFVLFEELGPGHARSSELIPVSQLHIFAFTEHVLSSPCVEVVEEQILALCVVGIKLVLFDLLLVYFNSDLLA